MSHQARVVVLDVNLSCHRCHKKIRKVLNKYGDKWDIKTITYDQKNDKVTLSGSFDPEKLTETLCKKACEVIREWCIKEPEMPKPKPPPQPPPPKPEPPKKPEAPKSEPPKPCLDPPGLPTCYHPYPCPYPVPIFYTWGGCDGHNKPCFCGGFRPCACGCGGGCSGPHQPQPTFLAYGRLCHGDCEAGTTSVCNIM